MISRNLRLTILHRFRFTEANARVATQGNGEQSNVLTFPLQKLMKKSMLLLVTLFIFTSVTLMAQSPQKINFQSIVRNTNGVIFSNKTLSFKISLLSDSITGTQVYSETHTSTTDAIGLVSLQIGSGTALSGVFANINWGDAAHFIKLEADFNGGNNYVLLGTQELMSVPYAIYASKTDTASLNLTNRFSTKLNLTDTASLSNRIDSKLSKTDTSLLNLTNRFSTKLNITDTASLSNRIDNKLNKTDTSLLNLSSRLATKLNLTDTASLSNRIDAKLNKSDTSLLNLSSRLATKLNLTDTASLSNRIDAKLNKTDTSLLNLTSRLSTKLNITDTAFLSDRIDSKLSKTDTSLLNLTSRLATKLNVTDTAFLSNRIDNKLNKTDTSLLNLTNRFSTKLNKEDFPSGSNVNEILYWNGSKWESLAPGTTGQSIIMSSTGLSWGCIITNTAAAPSSSPTLLVNTALPTPITIATTGATGIDTTASGLPAGVTASWSANVITISGSPTAVGTFNYTFSLTGGCGSVNATGTITVTCVTNAAAAPSSSPTLLVNTALPTPITIATTGATGINTTASGLPAGVTASWSANVITISGTPTAEGTFNYNISLTGGCGTVNATGTITVTAAPSFTCGTNTIADFDGNNYNSVLIGTQCWMKENLKVTKYNDGTAIPDETATTSSGWGALTTGARTEYVAAGVTGYVSTYGYLYNWYAAKGIATAGSTTYKNICPTGWHVPTDAEWTTLTTYLGGDPGTKMKKNDALWSPNKGTNSSGFSALPGGFRNYPGSFGDIRGQAFFWSATENGSYYAWVRLLYGNVGFVDRNYYGFEDITKSSGASVRCLRD